jgi:hypothetical protein
MMGAQTMTLHGKKPFHVLAITIFLLAAAPYSSRAMVFIETHIATGAIAYLQDKVITLDTGISYYPASPGIKVGVGVGSQVTLRFFTDPEGKNRYTQVAAGKNSLPPVPPPMQTRRGMK